MSPSGLTMKRTVDACFTQVALSAPCAAAAPLADIVTPTTEIVARAARTAAVFETNDICETLVRVMAMLALAQVAYFSESTSKTRLHRLPEHRRWRIGFLTQF